MVNEDAQAIYEGALNVAWTASNNGDDELAMAISRMVYTTIALKGAY